MSRIKRSYTDADARHAKTIDQLWRDEQRRQQQADIEMRTALAAYVQAGPDNPEQEPS